MQNFDKNSMERILSSLDEKGYLFPQFQLIKVNDKLDLLGQGGFSTVYEMFNRERIEIHYALKVIGFEKHSATSELFWNTVRMQSTLCQDSSNVVRILEAKELLVKIDCAGQIQEVKEACSERWSENDLHLQFVLMEKLDEILIRDRFHRAVLLRKELNDEAEVIRFAMQIGQALFVAHGYSILHRDVKLENIFWDEKERCYKLGDFGLAKYVESGNADTVVYTDGYGAPEIERRLQDKYNAAADIYSFGITLYLLLNNLKFPGSDGYYSKTEIQYNPEFIFPAPEFASINMVHVIRKMCSYRVEDRYQHIAEVLTDLAYVAKKNGLIETEEFMEFADYATETFREEKKTQQADDSSDIPKTRAARKEEQKIIDSLYRSDSIKYFATITVIMTLLFKGMQMDTSMITNWMFWILPILVCIEAIFQRIREFHLLFGILVILFLGYSIYGIGLTLPHIVLLVCVLIGVSTLSFAGAFATGFWMFLTLMHYLSFLDYFVKKDLGWIFLVALFLAVNRLLDMRIMWEKETATRVLWGKFIYDKMFIIMILTGVVLVGLQYFGVLSIPEVVKRMHFVRTGIISMIGMCFIVWWDGDFDELDSIEGYRDKGVANDKQMDK